MTTDGQTQGGSQGRTREDAEKHAASLWAQAKTDADGLVACVVLDRAGGDLRMVGYMNEASLVETLQRGRVVFWSRSKQRLWEKGESSGNVLELRELRIDCDGDAIACYVDAVGPTCHTGARSCFFRREEKGALRFDDGPAPLEPTPTSPPAASLAASQASSVLAEVFQVIEDRKAGRGMTNPDEKSYVRSLLDKGIPKINSKIAEEGAELCAALSRETDERVASEAADLFFHAMVGLAARDLKLEDVEAVFRRRFGVSGIDEKASRKRPTGERPTGERDEG